jgi:hypothetical protein
MAMRPCTDADRLSPEARKRIDAKIEAVHEALLHAQRHWHEYVIG